MAPQRKPIKAKLHSAAKAISNKDKETLVGANNIHKQKVEDKQTAIDLYNLIEVSATVPELSWIDLQGSNIIVKLHKENYIKTVELLPSGDAMYDAWFSQIDGRKHTANKAKWVDNPLPYVWTGVIHKISSESKAAYARTTKEMAGYGIEYNAPQEGDIVRLSPFLINDQRYYLNEQHRDFIKNPEEFRIVHFDGLVKIHSSMIVAVVTNQEAFNDTISPFREYKQYQAGKEMAKKMLVNQQPGQLKDVVKILTTSSGIHRQLEEVNRTGYVHVVDENMGDYLPNAKAELFNELVKADADKFLDNKVKGNTHPTTQGVSRDAMDQAFFELMATGKAQEIVKKNNKKK